jgi:hypothetical protein
MGANNLTTLHTLGRLEKKVAAEYGRSAQHAFTTTLTFLPLVPQPVPKM